MNHQRETPTQRVLRQWRGFDARDYEKRKADSAKPAKDVVAPLFRKICAVARVPKP